MEYSLNEIAITLGVHRHRLQGRAGCPPHTGLRLYRGRTVKLWDESLIPQFKALLADNKSHSRRGFTKANLASDTGLTYYTVVRMVYEDFLPPLPWDAETYERCKLIIREGKWTRERIANAAGVPLCFLEKLHRECHITLPQSASWNYPAELLAQIELLKNKPLPKRLTTEDHRMIRDRKREDSRLELEREKARIYRNRAHDIQAVNARITELKNKYTLESAQLQSEITKLASRTGHIDGVEICGRLEDGQSITTDDERQNQLEIQLAAITMTWRKDHIDALKMKATIRETARKAIIDAKERHRQVLVTTRQEYRERNRTWTRSRRSWIDRNA